jgi:hypothetical protein
MWIQVMRTLITLTRTVMGSTRIPENSMGTVIRTATNKNEDNDKDGNEGSNET